MVASVDFLAKPVAKPKSGAAARRPSEPEIYIPASAVRDGAVFIHLNGKAVKRPVKTGPETLLGVRIDKGLSGGEELIINPPQNLKDGEKVKIRVAQSSDRDAQGAPK